MGDPKSLLLVDDDEAIRETLASLLAEHGYDVVTAETAAAAERLLREQPVDIAVIDLVLPGEGGLDLWLRCGGTLLSGAKTIFLSASHATLPDGLVLLRKPFAIELLLQAIADTPPTP